MITTPLILLRLFRKSTIYPCLANFSFPVMWRACLLASLSRNVLTRRLNTSPRETLTSILPPSDLKRLFTFATAKKSLLCRNACYIGETGRHFSTRVREHLSSDKSSHIFKHLLSSERCRQACSTDCFEILDSAPTKFQLKLKEAMHIN